MKTRQGFVANSSSTSFYFATNTDYKGLMDLILKYRKHFYFAEEGRHVNAANVVVAIEDLDKEAVTTADEAQELRTTAINLSMHHPGRHNDGFWDSYAQSVLAVVDKLQAAHDKGLTKVYRIDFGDNDGDVSGNDVGCIMDYQGRDIDINEDDLVIVTEQNR